MTKSTKCWACCPSPGGSRSGPISSAARKPRCLPPPSCPPRADRSLRAGLRTRARWLPGEHYIGVPVRESEGLIQSDGRGVGLVDVEHDLEQAAGTQVTQPYHGQCAAEAGAALGGIDPDDVDLADRLMAVAGRPVAGIRPRAVDLGPVKANDLSAALGQEEAVRVEPRFPLPQVEIGAGPSALLRMAGEGLAVDLDPLVLVAAGHEGADRDAVGDLGPADPGLQ